MTLLEVEGLTKRYSARRSVLRRAGERFTVVDEVSLVVKRGETVALVGESGAGKSTTAQMIMRLLVPDAGTIRFDGVDLLALDRRSLRRHRKRMQMIFQDPYGSLDPRMDIGSSVAEALLLHTRMGQQDRRRRAAELLERVGLSARDAGRRPHELSGGQLQRVAIARAVAPEPDLLVCDEPVAALDVSVRAQVLNLLADLQAETKVSLLFVTHDLSLVRAIADRVVVMRRGRVVEAAVTEELFTRPTEPYTKELLAAVPSLQAALRGAVDRKP